MKRARVYIDIPKMGRGWGVINLDDFSLEKIRITNYGKIDRRRGDSE